MRPSSQWGRLDRGTCRGCAGMEYVSNRSIPSASRAQVLKPTNSPSAHTFSIASIKTGFTAGENQFIEPRSALASAALARTSACPAMPWPPRQASPPARSAGRHNVAHHATALLLQESARRDVILRRSAPPSRTRRTLTPRQLAKPSPRHDRGAICDFSS